MQTTPKPANPPRPKALTRLTPDTREALRARVAATSARAVGRELLVSDGIVRRACDGHGILPAHARLLELQLAPNTAATHAA